VTEESKNPDAVSEDTSEPRIAEPENAAEVAPLDPLEEARAEAAQFKDKLMRTAADFDNYRKRSRREVTEAEKKGRDSLLNDLLPVFDNLERATAHGETASGDADAAAIKGLIDGISLVMRQFRDAIGRLGIERVESLGKPFDPSLHEAIQHLETAEYPPGCIAAEVQPGYRAGERLIRPALVVVAKAPAVQAGSRVDEVTTSGEDAPQSAGGESKDA
jgi:molecular chaperone GrpE